MIKTKLDLHYCRPPNFNGFRVPFLPINWKSHTDPLLNVSPSTERLARGLILMTAEIRLTTAAALRTYHSFSRSLLQQQVTLFGPHRRYRHWPSSRRLVGGSNTHDTPKASSSMTSFGHRRGCIMLRDSLIVVKYSWLGVFALTALNSALLVTRYYVQRTINYVHIIRHLSIIYHQQPTTHERATL